MIHKYLQQNFVKKQFFCDFLMNKVYVLMTWFNLLFFKRHVISFIYYPFKESMQNIFSLGGLSMMWHTILPSESTYRELTWIISWGSFEDTQLPHSYLTRQLTLWDCWELSVSLLGCVCYKLVRKTKNFKPTPWACCKILIRWSDYSSCSGCSGLAVRVANSQKAHSKLTVVSSCEYIVSYM